MKKFLFILLFIIFLVFIAGILVWTNKEKAVSYILSKDFTVPVKVGKIDFEPNRLILRNFEIGNPPSSDLPRALFCKTITFYYLWEEIRDEVFTIDAIAIEDIDLQVEFYNQSGDTNNWTQIVEEDDKDHSSKEYRIKLVDLKNLVLTLQKYKSKPTIYPSIGLTLYNITNESGVPIDEIEKAIFYEALKSVFQKYSLPNLLDKVNPVKIFPKIIPFWKKSTPTQPQEE